MAGFSFSSQGSTPFNVGTTSATTPMLSGGTPQAKALYNAGSGNSQSSYAALSPGQFGGSIFPKANDQAVKSHAITTASGDTFKTEYHAPDKQNTVSTPGLLNTSGQPISQAGGSPVPTGGGLSVNATPNNAQPITGNVTTPSGAVVNATTGQTISAPAPTAPTFPGLLGNAANAATGNIPIGQRAADIAAKYGQEYADVGRKGANAESGYLTTGTSPVAEGNAAVIAQNTAAQQQAIAQGEQAALQGTGQQLTAQNQATSGLNTAAGLAQPNVAAYGQTVFNPLTGQYEGGGGLPPEVMQQYAQMAANGQISSIPSSITSNPVLAAQLNAAAKAINPNYTPVTSAAQGASAADLTTQASQIQANANGAEANFKLLVDTAQKGGVNDTTVPALNTLQNNLARGLTSSEAVTLFRNTLNTVRNQYATILGGGTATDMSRGIAADQIPDDISLSALQALETQLKSESGNRIAGINQQITQLTGGKTSNSTGTNTTSGTGGFAETW